MVEFISKIEANSAEASTLLKSIANKTRLMIVSHLFDNEMSVGELLDKIPLSQSAMSQHLSILRRENIVSTRRAAQTIYYTLASREARAILKTLSKSYGSPKTT